MDNAVNSSQEPYASDYQSLNALGPNIKDHGVKEDQSKSFGAGPFSQPFIVSNNTNSADHQGDLSLGYQPTLFTSPAFMHSRIDASMSNSFLQEATHILNLYN